MVGGPEWLYSTGPEQNRTGHDRNYRMPVEEAARRFLDRREPKLRQTEPRRRMVRKTTPKTPGTATGTARPTKSIIKENPASAPPAIGGLDTDSAMPEAPTVGVKKQLLTEFDAALTPGRLAETGGAAVTELPEAKSSKTDTHGLHAQMVVNLEDGDPETDEEMPNLDDGRRPTASRMVGQ